MLWMLFFDGRRARRRSAERHAPGESRFCTGGQAQEIARDGEIVAPDDRGAHIDGDVIAGNRPARARIATRLAGPTPLAPSGGRRLSVDIIAGASLARRTVNLPISVVKITVVGPGPVCGSRLRAVWKMFHLSPGPIVRIHLPPARSLLRTCLP